MTNLVTKLDEILDSNLVFFIESKTDLKLLDELKLNSNIINKIKEIIKNDKNKLISFYL
ncbi:MAG: hypothetical protein Q8S84_08015 [bacterium]|nr:hypothetical protein [bacterium]MDP3381383.1 hypothetical protein [bacterium]